MQVLMVIKHTSRLLYLTRTTLTNKTTLNECFRRTFSSLSVKKTCRAKWNSIRVNLFHSSRPSRQQDPFKNANQQSGGQQNNPNNQRSILLFLIALAIPPLYVLVYTNLEQKQAELNARHQEVMQFITLILALEILKCFICLV